MEVEQCDTERFGIIIKNQGLFLQIPLGDNQYRLGSTQRAQQVSLEDDPTLEEFQLLANDYMPEPITLKRATWLSKFHINYRRVESFNKGRVLLAGDASHIHSPAGGQGMNTGIQDAYNLGWKLALVYQGRVGYDLLTSYSQERAPIAKFVLWGTEQLTRLVTLHSPLLQGLRNHLLPMITHFDFVQDKIVNTLSQVGINYRQSPIVGEDWSGAAAGLKPGDRAPTLAFAQGTKHRVLLFLVEQSNDIVTTIEKDYADLLEVKIIANDEKLHAIYGVTTQCLYLIRPDGYIAYRNSPLRAETFFAFLKRYLAN